MSFKAKGLDHVAIAVKDLDAGVAFYRDVLRLKLAELEEVPEQEVRTAIFGEGLGRVELICPTTEGSGLAKFLQKRGEGLHHICLEVDDLEAALAELRSQGTPLIDDAPKPGAGGARVAFIHPKGAHGVLVELREGPKGMPRHSR
ncbi:MAG TPA: methylmalonyl-CoA epimerase [Myxococcaceae bacterium]|nr:methylmalonyl-CoA epimerase [Myxococcaceae bacterium]